MGVWKDHRNFFTKSIIGFTIDDLAELFGALDFFHHAIGNK